MQLALFLSSLNQPVLDLYTVRLLQHGVPGKPEEQPCSSGMYAVHGKSGDVAGHTGRTGGGMF